MKRKARAKKASPRGAQGSSNGDIKAKENAPLKEITKQIWRPTKPPTGKGLGKAGAKRLGRLLKRAIQDQEGSSARLPKTPVRLFKHQVQTEAQNAPKTNAAKPASPHVSQLILSVVSQCKHRGGISMAELKQTLAAGGYNVTKNNRRVNVATKRLVNNETLIRTTRNVSDRLNNKKKTDTKQVKTSSVKSPPKKGLKQSKTTNKPTKGAEKSQSPARKTPKPKGKTRKPAAGSQKPKEKNRRAAAKSHKPRRKTTKARRKSPKPAGKKRRSATHRTAGARKAPKNARRARRLRPKQKRHPYKSSQKRQSRRLPKTKSRLKTQRRRVYYY